MACCSSCSVGRPCGNPLAQGRVMRSGVALGSLYQLGGYLYAPADGRQDAERATATLVGDSDPDPVVPSADDLCEQYGHLPGMSHLCELGGGGGGGTSPPALPPGMPPTYPPHEMPPIPGVVSESDCRARETAALDQGRALERKAIVVPALIGGVASAAAGIFVGYLASRIP